MIFVLSNAISLLPDTVKSNPVTRILKIQEAHAEIVFVRNIGTAQIKGMHTELRVTITGQSVPAGNTVVVAIALDSYVGDPDPQCSDQAGNTYNTDVNTPLADNTFRVTVFSAHITNALSVGDTITVTHTSLNASAMSVNEFFGLASSGPLDQIQSATGSSTAPSSGNTAMTTQADELLFGAIAVEGPVTDAFTVGTGYTALTRQGTTGGSAASNMTINPEFRIVSSIGTYTADGTLGTSRDWAAGISTYKASVISVSVSNSTFAFAVAIPNTWLPPQASVITNDGAVAENFVGQINQFTESSNTWEIAVSANGADTIRAQWSITSETGPWTYISAYDTDFTIATNVAASDSVLFWFRIQTPTSTTSYNEYSSTLTVTAEQF